MGDLIEKLPLDKTQTTDKTQIDLLRTLLSTSPIEEKKDYKQLVIILVSLIGSLSSRLFVTRVMSDEKSIIATQIGIFIVLYGIVKYLLN